MAILEGGNILQIADLHTLYPTIPAACYFSPDTLLQLVFLITLYLHVILI